MKKYEPQTKNRSWKCVSPSAATLYFTVLNNGCVNIFIYAPTHDSQTV